MSDNLALPQSLIEALLADVVERDRAVGRAAQAVYREENRPRVLASKRVYRKVNREVVVERNRDYNARPEVKERKREYAKEYDRTEATQARRRELWEANKEAHAARRKARYDALTPDQRRALSRGSYKPTGKPVGRPRKQADV